MGTLQGSKGCVGKYSSDGKYQTNFTKVPGVPEGKFTLYPHLIKNYFLHIYRNNNVIMSSYFSLYIFQISYPSVTKLQKEGALTEEKVLDHAVKMMNIVQECNVLLKWMMLHTAPLSPGNVVILA